MDKELDGVQACCSGGDVVRDVKKIAAGGAADAILDRAVVVSFLLDYGVVVYDFVVSPTILRYA